MIGAFRDRPLSAGAPRIAVIGSLVSCDFILADALQQEGVAATVLRGPADAGLSDLSPVLFPNLRQEHVLLHATKLELVRQLRRFDFVFSFTSALGFALGKRMYAYPALERLGWPPYLNLATGSDMMERAVERSREGALERFTIRHAYSHSIVPYPESIRNAARLRLRNFCVLPQVLVTPPPPVPDSEDASRFRRSESELLLFHPSNLDWAEADPPPRASTKGNDRFIRAFARFLREAPRETRLIMLHRGPDRDAAKRLVAELGIEPWVVWHESLERDDLYAAIRESDVVVDQFDVGALGLTALEALQLGRPVLIYVEPNAQRLVFDEVSPVLMAHTEDEILARLHEAADPERCAELAESARRWAASRAFASFLPRYLVYTAVATGNETIEFGWNRPFGHARSARDA